jgi:hypothetical protein
MIFEKNLFALCRLAFETISGLADPLAFFFLEGGGGGGGTTP